ncbi:hypothetical protein F2P56_024596 [Juglans regia]|uniref:Reverse transcriptase domain-containing protein n=2 Tax=Juglans regia TaxID=51240 RepID=A0A833TSX9_JUGRE|nr:uncharacterized protein LOC109018027 [Juglans regia]KAF5454971.1 hypothetical protein F2P56_024596 [Juglans regia]
MALEKGNLSDLGWRGNKFTWSNKHEDDTFTKERSDRVANPSWAQLYRDYWVEVLAGRSSDHRPLLLTLCKEGRSNWRGRKVFRYENSWAKEDDCEKVIRRVWVSSVEMGEHTKNFKNLLESCNKALVKWNDQNKVDRVKKIKEKTEFLKKLQDEESRHNSTEIKRVQRDVGLLLEKDDVKWKQRAKRNWHASGDRNTKFFHACANQRRMKNSINQVRDEQGRVFRSHVEVDEAFRSYFERLFSTSNPSTAAMEECLQHVVPRVTSEMNEKLRRTFSRLEIEEAIKSMAPLKSPGSDVFGACFYQNHWATIGDKVCLTVLDLLNGKIPFNSINYTFIALIPKTKDPKLVTEYRSISLCNVIYKMVSKVIANRLKEVLSVTISTNQSVFIPGRIITDNVMVAYEVLHSIKVRKKGKEGSMAIELDMSKAYDKMEWPYVGAVMKRLGFCDEWADLIMKCISLVSFSVLINGKPRAIVNPSRGLRQGDPLSPLIYLSCVQRGLALYSIIQILKGTQKK